MEGGLGLVDTVTVPVGTLGVGGVVTVGTLGSAGVVKATVAGRVTCGSVTGAPSPGGIEGFASPTSTPLAPPRTTHADSDAVAMNREQRGLRPRRLKLVLTIICFRGAAALLQTHSCPVRSDRQLDLVHQEGHEGEAPPMLWERILGLRRVEKRTAVVD